MTDFPTRYDINCFLAIWKINIMNEKEKKTKCYHGKMTSAAGMNEFILVVIFCISVLLDKM